MEHIWNWGGREYAFDVSESESIAVLGEALATLREGLQTAEEDLSAETGDTALAIASYCAMIRGFFDTVLGLGAGVVVCGEKQSAKEHTAAYFDFIHFMDAEVRAFSALPKKIGEKYEKRVENLAVGGDI